MVGAFVSSLLGNRLGKILGFNEGDVVSDESGFGAVTSVGRLVICPIGASVGSFPAMELTVNVT